MLHRCSTISELCRVESDGFFGPLRPPDFAPQNHCKADPGADPMRAANRRGRSGRPVRCSKLEPGMGLEDRGCRSPAFARRPTRSREPNQTRSIAGPQLEQPEIRPDLGRARLGVEDTLRCIGAGRCLPNFGPDRSWPTQGRVRPKCGRDPSRSVEFGPHLLNFGQLRPPHRPILPGIGQVWAISTNLGPKNWPRSTPHAARDCSEFGADFGQTSPGIDEAWHRAGQVHRISAKLSPASALDSTGCGPECTKLAPGSVGLMLARVCPTSFGHNFP